MTVDFGSINWLALAVAAAATFVLGGAWYTALFGQAWQKAHHLTEESMKAMQAVRPMHVFLVLQFVSYIVVALGMALIVSSTGISSAGEGAILGLFVLIVTAAVMMTHHLPTNVTWAGYLIDVTFVAVYCVGTGALLGAWR